MIWKKIEQVLETNPWKLFYAKDENKSSQKVTKYFTEMKLNTSQYFAPDLKSNTQLASLFPRRVGIFLLLNKQLRSEKKIGLLAVEIIPKKFRKFGKNLKNDDVIFEFTIKNLEKRTEYGRIEGLESLTWSGDFFIFNEICITQSLNHLCSFLEK